MRDRSPSTEQEEVSSHEEFVQASFGPFQVNMTEFVQKYSNAVTYSLFYITISRELIGQIEEVKRDANTCIQEIDAVR